MASVTRIPRSRGGVSGVLLILLGAWGGLVPFVGPYFHYAYTPDKALHYTSGRLWLSIVPGAAALLGGLLVVLATHRAVGLFGGLLGALGGAWFIVGASVTALVVKNGSITAGSPLTGPVGPLSSADDLEFSQASGAAAYPAGSPEEESVPATTGEFPAAGSRYPRTEQAETSTERYRTTTGRFRRSPSGDPGAL